MTTSTTSLTPTSARAARRRPSRLLAAGVVVPLGLMLAACGASDDSGSRADTTDYAGAPAPQAEYAADGALDSMSLREARAPGSGSAGQSKDEAGDPMTKAIIATGNVALAADDVDDAVFDVQKVVDQYRGEISEQNTTADDEGSVRTARLVIRIPSEDFQDAFVSLEKVAKRISSTSSTEDVTTEVIDNKVRIRAQRRSLQRVEVLLDRARSISDIVRIEAQLTRRQSKLDSLEQRQAYLADQTSMSTITVSVERTAEDRAPTTTEEETGGFIGGLEHGWDALVSVGTGLALVVGWLLPFLGIGLLVLLPLLLVVRRARRSTAPPAAATD